MNLPFTTGQFLEILAAYNRAIWPIQAAAYALGAAAVFFLFRRSRNGDRFIILLLSSMWVWTGIAYHLVFFTRINRAAWVFGVLFVLCGLLIFRAGFFRPGFSFQWKRGAASLAGGVFVVYAMAVYPLLGFLSGHVYPESPVFGVTPCPVTIFTFGFFLLARGKVPLGVLIIPFIWSLVGGSAAWSLGVPEDYGLLAAGIFGFVLVLQVPNITRMMTKLAKTIT